LDNQKYVSEIDNLKSIIEEKEKNNAQKIKGLELQIEDL
jgi:hypothetical protein